MRTITSAGWNRIVEGFSYGGPRGDVVAFWEWACEEGTGFRLAAWFVLATADVCPEDFDGKAQERWTETRVSASPLRLARSLDDVRKALVADFIVDAQRLVR